jgi:hypothetical protein
MKASRIFLAASRAAFACVPVLFSLAGCTSLSDAMLSDETKACRAKGSQMVPTKYTSMMNFYGEMVYDQEYECLP